MNPEELFVKTLDDLSMYAHSTDEYKILLSSALIRKLMIDGNSLLNQANRNYKSRIRFEVAEIPELPQSLQAGLEIWSIIEELDPNFNKRLSKRLLTIDEFLGTIIGICNGHKYSIRDLVKLMSDVNGGVHSGSAKLDKELSLNKWGSFRIDDLNILTRQLRVVARIILTALKQLKEAILQTKEFENCEGRSVYLLLALFEINDRNNFIFDYGIEENRSRFFAFIDSGGQLWLKLIDSNGNRFEVSGGRGADMRPYGKMVYLSFKLSVLPDKLMLTIDFGIWSAIKIFNVKTDFPLAMHFVIGSNLFGREPSNLAIVAKLVYQRTLTLEENKEVNEDLLEKLTNIQSVVRFQGNQSMRSDKHPNFE